MKQNAVKNKHGFTLIELLVVVLIIGILSAIALPGYRKSVEKSRVTDALTTMGAVAKSEHAWYLEHSNYTDDFANLDIELTGTINEGALETDFYTYELLDTGILAERNNGEYFVYKDYENQQILCTPGTHYICENLGAFTKEPCENAEMAWANTNSTCYVDKEERCKGLYPDQNLWNDIAEICGYKGVRTFKKTLDEGMECITVNNYSDCESLTVNEGAKCISQTYEGCAWSTFNGGICEGHGNNGCINSTFNAGGECHPYNGNACRGSVYIGTGCCRGSKCQSEAPKCECEIDPNTGQHLTSC